MTIVATNFASAHTASFTNLPDGSLRPKSKDKQVGIMPLTNMVFPEAADLLQTYLKRGTINGKQNFGTLTEAIVSDGIRFSYHSELNNMAHDMVVITDTVQNGMMIHHATYDTDSDVWGMNVLAYALRRKRQSQMKHRNSISLSRKKTALSRKRQ